jgi:Uma2 family endonuclease
MAEPALNLPTLSPPPEGEQRVVLTGVDWRTYCTARELFDSPAVRMTYIEGLLEIMSPSRRHEGIKTLIARLVEQFAVEAGVPLYGYGSTTFKREARERGLEPDECYSVGKDMGEYPDIAIEVAITSGGINKLRVYEGLGVREVWLWREGRFEIYALRQERYQLISASGLMPRLDFAELAEFVEQPDQHRAVLEYRNRLRARLAQRGG